MSMRRRAEKLIEGIKELINKTIMREADFDSIANLNSEDLEMLKTCNGLLNDSYEFMVDEVEMIEETHDQVEDLRKDMKEVNRKLNIILSKLQEKEE